MQNPGDLRPSRPFSRIVFAFLEMRARRQPAGNLVRDTQLTICYDLEMQIHINYTTQLKAALGKDNEFIDLQDGATVQSAINHLAEVYPPEFADLVMLDGKPLPSILFSVNDKQVSLDEPIHEGDTLTLLSAISGG